MNMTKTNQIVDPKVSECVLTNEDELFEVDIDYPSMEMDEEGFYSGECECGGTVLPMYDEQPFLVLFCRKCDRRW